jgi:hypothetical protein
VEDVEQKIEQPEVPAPEVPAPEVPAPEVPAPEVPTEKVEMVLDASGNEHPESECEFVKGKPVGRRITLLRVHSVNSQKYGPGEVVVPLELFHSIRARDQIAPKNLGRENV